MARSIIIVREIIESFGFDAQSVAEAPADSAKACKARAVVDGEFGQGVAICWAIGVDMLVLHLVIAGATVDIEPGDGRRGGNGRSKS